VVVNRRGINQEGTMKPVKKILVAIDLSEPSKAVVEAGLEMARALDASLELVHVREPYVYAVAGAYGPSAAEEQALLHWIDRSLAKAAEEAHAARITCNTTSLYGSPAPEIVAHARKTEADLIIVGTHGRGGVRHAVLGSTAERVVQKAHRPVLVVPVEAAA
jgi:nucleotide-binding universal stress UspA family protein